MKKIKRKIQCPKCGTVQNAEVIMTVPFETYVHTCEECRSIITESEWEEVNPNDYIDDRAIEELELFFKAYENLPQILLTPHLFISEPQKFVEKNLYVVKNTKKKAAKPYFDLLMEYKKRIE